MERFFENRTITLYPSGTAALAQAIAQCVARKSVSAPEVIIPAYGCPNLVAACLYASAFPRLVDVSPKHWAYDTESLKANVSPNTVAVVAVNLLGLGDGATELAQLCKDRGICLIQDSAQHLPREVTHWPGDYVVLSFGRGKPLNLLHGGALVAPPGDTQNPSGVTTRYALRDRLLASRLAGMAFNVLTRPFAYRLLSSFPGTGLGAVPYNALRNAEALPEHAWHRVGTAFTHYREAPSYRRELWTAALEEWSHRGILALDAPSSPLPPEPLRLALLASDRQARDRLVGHLSGAGLGASRFYGSALPELPGIPDVVGRQGPFPNANALGGRLFTLPTHRLVSARRVRSATALVARLNRTPRSIA
jgi:hypothetical protein